MPCAHPRPQWRVEGKWTFTPPLCASLFTRQEVACKQCASCRLARGGEWTTRLVHEGQSHPFNCCATFTYAPEHLPPHGSLRRTDASALIRALRKRVARRGGPLFSVDTCGEYSPPPLMRPHLHVALFGYWPPDAKPWAKSQSGNQEYISDELSSVWGKGRVTFQDWSHGAATYCAGHQAWKLTGDMGRLQRIVVGPDGTAIAEREPEFHQPSTRPGIGRRFFEKHAEQMLRNGFTVAKDRAVPPPAYFIRRALITHPELAAVAVEARRLKAVEAAADLNPSRREAIETCSEATILRGSRKSGLR